uniref:Immunoglobulin light 3 variable 5 n=1 Tax=Cynoglossus semilaevis TaxID=244447 RepID=A0A3P8UZB7_CYNSE
LTFGGGTKLILNLGTVKPTLTVLPPSKEELALGNVTVVCVASEGFPPEWNLGWKKNGGAITSGLLLSSPELQSNGRYKRSSTLKMTADEWRNANTVSCEATLKNQSPVTASLEPNNCSD